MPTTDGWVSCKVSPSTPWSFGSSWRNRQVPLLCTLAMLVVGALYLFLWNPLVHHTSTWATGGDMWGIFRGAHYVSWGYLGGVYTQGNGIVSFPGMPILLSPVALLSSAFHLTESYGQFVLPRPTAALILLPVEVVISATSVFAADALAECLGASKRRRIALCSAVAILAWSTSAAWGHAEDALAMTFALYGLQGAFAGRWRRTAWLLGLAILMQPLAALLLPLIIGAAPAGHRLAVTVRAACLSVVLVAVAFIGDPADTYRALVLQPTPPAVNHATPWVALAPHVANASAPDGPVNIYGHTLTAAPVAKGADTLVAGGPGRTLYVLIAVLLGIYVWRRPQGPRQLLWLAAFALGLRCFFESVMTPYYLVPPMIVALIAVALTSWGRLWASMVIGFGTAVFAYFHLAPWVWWLPIVVGMGAVLALGYPGGVFVPRTRRQKDELNGSQRRGVPPISEPNREGVLTGVGSAPLGGRTGET